MNIQRGTLVHHIDDPRHDGIVRTLSLINGEFFANVQWINTGWHSHRIPVEQLNISDQQVGPTECDAMHSALRRN